MMTTPVATPGSTRVGFIGTGVMGRSMCGHILKAGYAVTLYNRTAARADELVKAGAVRADSPRAVAERSDVIISIVGYPADVREITLGPGGTLVGSRAGVVLIDMTTSEPSLAREIADAAAVRQVAALDAPVSGGDTGARNGTLSIMVGGDAETFTAVRPICDRMGRTVVHQGPAGSGQHAKMVNQILIAGALEGVCEAMLYAVKSGLDPLTVLQSVGGGAAASWQLQNLAPKMIGRDWEPGFYAEHFLKDIGIALGEARRMKLALPGLALVGQLLNAVEALGLGREGTQALYQALERLSATRP